MFNPAKGFLVGLTSYQFSFQSYAKRSCGFCLKLTLFGQTFVCSKLVSYRSYEQRSQCDKTDYLFKNDQTGDFPGDLVIKNSPAIQGMQV